MVVVDDSDHMYVSYLSCQVDRLMEMHFKYMEAVQLADKRIEGEKHVRTSTINSSNYCTNF